MTDIDSLNDTESECSSVNVKHHCKNGRISQNEGILPSFIHPSADETCIKVNQATIIILVLLIALPIRTMLMTILLI
jgi:hypothetical protein